MQHQQLCPSLRLRTEFSNCLRLIDRKWQNELLLTLFISAKVRSLGVNCHALSTGETKYHLASTASKHFSLFHLAIVWTLPTVQHNGRSFLHSLPCFAWSLLKLWAKMCAMIWLLRDNGMNCAKDKWQSGCNELIIACSLLDNCMLKTTLWPQLHDHCVILAWTLHWFELG